MIAADGEILFGSPDSRGGAAAGFYALRLAALLRSAREQDKLRYFAMLCIA